MPTYSYQCINGHVLTTVAHSSQRDFLVGEPCPNTTDALPCNLPLKRKWESPVMAEVFHGEFNDSLGQYVTSDADMRSKLSKLSDERSERLNLEHRFVMHDKRSDPITNHGVDDSGMGATHDAAVAEGIKESKGRFVF